MSDATQPSAAQKPSFGGRWTYAVLIVAVLFVSMPFLFWNATWFGRPLTDEQIAKAFQDRKHAREIQHALDANRAAHGAERSLGPSLVSAAR